MLLLIIVAAVVIALLLILNKLYNPQVVEPEQDEPLHQSCATCSGDNAKCEQECAMEAATKPIVYYDDEELDAFSGRPADGYTDDEAAQFAEVLYSMKPEEVAAWNRSLLLRGIQLPNQLKDEVIMLIDG